MVARLYTVKGRVQGVWFRESTRRYAQPLNIRGHAINLPNGDVEVLAVGEPDAVAMLEAWLHEGPPMASVVEVIAADANAGDLPTGFRTG